MGFDSHGTCIREALESTVDTVHVQVNVLRRRASRTCGSARMPLGGRADLFFGRNKLPARHAFYPRQVQLTQ